MQISKSHARPKTKELSALLRHVDYIRLDRDDSPARFIHIEHVEISTWLALEDASELMDGLLANYISISREILDVIISS